MASVEGGALGVDEVRDVDGLLSLVRMRGALEHLEVVHLDVIPDASLREHAVHGLLDHALRDAGSELRQGLRLPPTGPAEEAETRGDEMSQDYVSSAMAQGSRARSQQQRCALPEHLSRGHACDGCPILFTGENSRSVV